MTTRKILLAVAAVGLWLAGVAPSQASTITPNPSGLQAALTYEWQVVMGDSDLAQYSGAVGAKSWAEPTQSNSAKGWTHTSHWTALDLTGLTGPTVLTLDLGRGTTGELFPAFSLYSGWETVTSDVTNHTFNNTGNISWATNLTYIDSLANIGGPSGLASGTGLAALSKQWVLGPGLYTLNYGGNPSYFPGQTGSHDFSATLTTAPVPVPAAVWLFGSGIAGLIGLVRRRMAS